ncbi:MAG: hypothetical protein A2Y77_08595 [Planctomycetes bacterium RBG_13_62_9]|nr:MAG: hypothetical protein A2Y77_08595 [Planctomycetes bacterium RBG_13_62_9]
MMKKIMAIRLSIMLAVLAGTGTSAMATICAPTGSQFCVTYFDNYNYSSGQWEPWQESAGHQYWDHQYLVDLSSGKTNATSHYLPSIDTLDLRGGFPSLDGHASGGEDWNPLESVGDNASGQSPHHVFAATFTGRVHFNEGDILSLESDDDAYIFLDDNTDWGQEILSDPGIHYFDADTLTIPAELAGTHLMTVKFAERQDIHSGIAVYLNGAPIETIPAPGAIVLGSLGMTLVGWLRRRKSL